MLLIHDNRAITDHTMFQTRNLLQAHIAENNLHAGQMIQESEQITDQGIKHPENICPFYKWGYQDSVI